MTIDEFAAITRRIIAEDGFDGYLPTACYPRAREVVVLEGHPQPIVPADVVRQWAAERAGGETPYLIAFKVDATHFQVDLIDGVHSVSGIFDVTS